MPALKITHAYAGIATFLALAFDLSAAAKPAVSPVPERRASACIAIAARRRIVSIRSIVPRRKYIGSIRFSTGRRVEGSR